MSMWALRWLASCSNFSRAFGGCHSFRPLRILGSVLHNAKMAEVKLKRLLRLYKLRNKFDAVILAVHACLVEGGFRCINSGEEVNFWISLLHDLLLDRILHYRHFFTIYS